jgi:hypothetical protein
MAVCLALALSAQAQTLDVTTDALQRMLQAQPQLQQQYQQYQQQNQQSSQFPSTDLRPSLQYYQPVDPLRMPLAPSSRLEALYSERAGRQVPTASRTSCGRTPTAARRCG